MAGINADAKIMGDLRKSWMIELIEVITLQFQIQCS